MRQTKILIGLAICVTLVGCPDRQAIPVEATAFGTNLKTSVDTEAAQYYLEDYLTGERKRPTLDAELDRLHTEKPAPTPEFLRELSQRHSVDFAALYFMHYHYEQADNRRLRAAFERKVDAAAANGAPMRTCADCLVLFAPGWVYQTQPETGADFARERRLLDSLDIPNRLIETEEVGTVEENAALIADAIQRQSKGRKLILVSASKAGPEVALALDQLQSGRAEHAVAAWINIGGILRGSPLADWAQDWPQYPLVALLTPFRPWTLESIESMTTERNRARFESAELPPDMLVINYAAAPLSGQVTQGGNFGYSRLRPLGPNDGLTLLPDALVPQAPTLLAIGQDHYFLDPMRDKKTIAMLALVLDRLDNGDASRYSNDSTE